MPDRIPIVAAALYTFLTYCQDSPLDRVVLDCGAGGATPPLAMFRAHGFRTHGIEISARQLALARRFCQERDLELNLIHGDMRDLPPSGGDRPPRGREVHGAVQRR